jgi:tetratricopeptide (TPR) repeat protein
MDALNALPADYMEHAGDVILIEGNAGSQRRAFLEEALRRARERGARTWILPCHFDEGGPWAGVKTLFAELVPEIRTGNPELLVRHDYELLNAVPALKRSMSVRNPNLTDVASNPERVRNYPSDRAFRIIHGLIDLLAEWKAGEKDDGPWILACDDYSQSSYLARYFFRELMRRRGRRLGLVLLVAADPGATESIAGYFQPVPLAARLPLDLPADAPQPVDPEEALRRARELEERVADDPLEAEIHLSDLIRAWTAAGDPKKVFHWQFEALSVHNSLGFYEDALSYGRPALAGAKLYSPDDDTLHWRVFIKLFMCHVALGNAETALRIAEEEALGKVREAGRLCRLYYLVSMLYARYLPQRDLATAEDYLERGMEEIARAGLPDSEMHFQTVFNRNGLAMIRFFQGRFQEAIDLCREGFNRLEEHIEPGKHRLHRSVLLYNTAQVYSTVGAHDDAIANYTAAMEMDPNYSEYYNERGSIHLRLGHLAAAREDYLKAIELSPPYQEVRTNLGQCCRQMGLMEEAIEAYSAALDLDPNQVLALVGRAQAHEALGRSEAALADYGAALAVDSRQPKVLANRAVLLYEAGRFEESLADLTAALEHSSDLAELYQNRSVVLTDLQRYEEAAQDLRDYLRLNPTAEDRDEMLARLHALDADRSVA